MPDRLAGFGIRTCGLCLRGTKLHATAQWGIRVALLRTCDPPPLKWSAPRYGFEPEEDRDGEQEAPAGGGRGQAAAGGCPGLAGAVGGGGDPRGRRDGGDLLPLAAGGRGAEGGPGEAAEGAGGGE